MQAKSKTENRAEYCTGYSEDVDVIREREYPFLKDTTYLDHAGTTLYPKSLIDSFARDLTSNLFGNPHSRSASSQLSTQRIDDIRLRALRFFNADPDEFDLVFVANATAAIKLVADVFRDSSPQGFWYGYFIDAHTSLVGAREIAEKGHRCFLTGGEVEQWISELVTDQKNFPRLFAYPGQSNLNGRRCPMQWCKKIRDGSSNAANVYTLLDAASLVSTSPLDLSDASAAPDFTALSFYKIFGFPDLGALIVRKSAAGIIAKRKFFGGGTVDMVLAQGTPWHAKKSTIHERLEDGTLPFHNIIALDSALSAHERLFGSMGNVSSHTRYLAKRLHNRLAAMTHFNGKKVCHLYMSPESDFDNLTQGPIIAFNIRNSSGAWIGKSEVERLANVKKIHIRSGSHCNPGGTATSLGWTGPELLRNFSAGLRCGDDHDVMDGRPTGILRVSLGAVSNLRDIDTFTRFIDEFYIEKAPECISLVPPMEVSLQEPSFYVESLSVYPIKSCGAFKVPDDQRWEIKREGLAWDREWCLIHQGTGAALSMKKYPLMALIRPAIDLERGVLRITCGSDPKELEVSLRREITNLVTTSLCQSAKSSNVCGDRVVVQAYSSPAVASFFSNFLGVPCTLARFPPQISTRISNPTRSSRRSQRALMPGSFPEDPSPTPEQPPILLSNESPILLISRSSVNRLNENIKYSPRPSHSTPARAVEADVFRANIVVAENLHRLANAERPYIEDTWESFSIGPEQLDFDVLGSCQRCQMVCVDPYTGTRREEPYSTLVKTRKINSKIVFGRHASLSKMELLQDAGNPKSCTVMVGDVVTPQIS
ncbi:molybdenum cofactor sulfurase [Aspergillus pseudonomiae]|uniref:Molybdenum cofactor sulfurase n=1 Tax=Aspergillus pseudonomiae TaxID=1506151 RepID=A0A5N7D484_9EURO|nr:molybdenum cofactor sulfurase [Aspergillus pseudonomiae]KAB8265784.1 molybdenum cofactor sulfurase [Aspergillus pseudonomiae]KAE8401069.1 molybdenum cofactor sulfurase [Aspergillus pseudonomiae]